MQSFQFLFLAGYGNSTGEHWQAQWFRQHPNSIWIEQNWEQPNRDQWVNNIQSSVSNSSTPLVVISHSLGGLAFIEWANQYPEILHHKIRGAFLVALPDADAESFPKAISGFANTPLNKMTIPTQMIVSEDDPYASFERSLFFANAWGSELINIGKKGHINTSAGLGEWVQGEGHLHSFIKSL